MNGKLLEKLASASDRMASVNEPKKRKVNFPEQFKSILPARVATSSPSTGGINSRSSTPPNLH